MEQRPNVVGWVIAGFFLIGGAFFARMSETRLLGVIWMIVASFLLLLFWAMKWRAGRADQLRRTGQPGRAVVRGITDTGATLNEQPLVELTLDVQPDGLPAYTVTKRMVVPRVAVGQLTNGVPLSVHVDSKDKERFAIDWGSLSAAPMGAATVDTGDPEARLRKLKELRSGGLITEAEFESQRKRILESL